VASRSGAWTGAAVPDEPVEPVTEACFPRSILSLVMRRLHLTPRHALLASACASAAVSDGAFLLYERPRLGIGHF